MFSSQIPNPNDQVLQARLDRIKNKLRSLDKATREEYQVAVYSAVNAVLNLGNRMQPLRRFSAETPAVVGDVNLNLLILNEDATDIASALGATEDSAARLYNLAASVQNSLRQEIRERVYASNGRRFLEEFLNSKNFGDVSTTLDYVNGSALLPTGDDTEVSASSITVGNNSEGKVSSLDALTDGRVDTVMVFDGSVLELIISFAQPEIINRLQLDLDDYQGLEISAFSTSPDGSLFEDVLADLGDGRLILNGTTDKYSGDCVFEFPPRHVKQMRLVITDRIDVAWIALRGMSFHRRSYSSEGSITTKFQSAPIGKVKFTSTEKTWDGLTNISHQISFNGAHFTAIQPDSILTIDRPFQYRALLQRSDKAFSDKAYPLQASGADPKQSEFYKVLNISTVQLGSGVIERTINFDWINGPVTLKETPLPGSFRVTEGVVPLTPDDYSYINNVLAFPAEKYLISVSYQTSSLGIAAINDRKDYYTPILSEVRFEKV